MTKWQNTGKCMIVDRLNLPGVIYRMHIVGKGGVKHKDLDTLKQMNGNKEPRTCKREIICSLSVGDLHLTVCKTRKKEFYLLDNCCNPNKLDFIESEGHRYLIPFAVKLHHENEGYCDAAGQRRAGGMGKIEKPSNRKYRNVFMGLAQLLIFVNAELLWADIHVKNRWNSKDVHQEWINDVVQERWSRKPQNPNKLISRRKTDRGIEDGCIHRVDLRHEIVKYPKF